MMTRITYKTSNRWSRHGFKSSGRYPCAHITPTISQQEVTAVFVRESDHINYLTFLDVYGNEQVIETTDEHPFWVVTDDPDWSRAASGYFDGTYHAVLELDLLGFWVEAKDLQEGDVFIGANGEWSVFLSAERVEFPDGVTVYNFTVDGNHNYFVIAATDEFGQTCVLVHNADPWYKRWWENIKDWGNNMIGILVGAGAPPVVGDAVSVLEAAPTVGRSAGSIKLRESMVRELNQHGVGVEANERIQQIKDRMERTSPRIP